MSSDTKPARMQGKNALIARTSLFHFSQELKATAERVGVSKDKALEVVAKELKVSLS